MNRTFVTFIADSENGTYEKLLGALSESIAAFSKYPLRIYRPTDFGKDSATQILNSQDYRYKILSCLAAIDEGYDEAVWIDTDSIVTNNIDKVWFEAWRISDYPLLPKHRFYNFKNWPHYRVDYRNSSVLGSAKSVVGVTDGFSDVYLHACFMLFNKSCRSFFEEAIGYFNIERPDIFPFGDETILNCMIWKIRGRNLGSNFLCSAYFDPEVIERFIKMKDQEDFVELFNENRFLHNGMQSNFGWGFLNKEQHTASRLNLDNSQLINLPLIDNNFENILFFHGIKDANLHTEYINLIKDFRY